MEDVGTLRKYPRTQHVEGSGLQKGDEADYAAFAFLRDKELIVEEKLDGANTGVSFDEKGRLQLQCRGHYLTGGPGELQFALFKSWAQTHQTWLWEKLGTRFILYGEWLYAKHTVFYDALPHYFFEFDVLDTQADQFLSTYRRRALLSGGPIVSVPVLATQRFSRLSELTKWVRPSLYKSESWRDALKNTALSLGLDFELVLERETDTSELAEGLYLKWEEGGVVQGRYKFVRPNFSQTILDSGSHWKSRPILPNGLADGVAIW
jgi:hypothetical protein